MKKKVILTFIVCIALSFLASYLGGLLQDGNVQSEWYNSIKPEITPPGYIFPIVWTILFLLLGINFALCLLKSGRRWKKLVIAIFLINLFLNVIWSWFYFGLRNPALAFFDIVLLWISIVFIIFISLKINKNYGWISVPYLLWVSFAAVLNWLSIL